MACLRDSSSDLNQSLSWQTEAGSGLDPEVGLMWVYESENESTSVPGETGLSEWPVRASRSSWSGVQELTSSTVALTELGSSLTCAEFSWARPSFSGDVTWQTFGRSTEFTIWPKCHIVKFVMAIRIWDQLKHLFKEGHLSFLCLFWPMGERWVRQQLWWCLCLWLVSRCFRGVLLQVTIGLRWGLRCFWELPLDLKTFSYWTHILNSRLLDMKSVSVKQI